MGGVQNKQFLGAFGTNCPRELKLLPPSSRGDLPGPGSYDYQVSNQPPVSVYGNSVFTSRFQINQTNSYLFIL